VTIAFHAKSTVFTTGQVAKICRVAPRTVTKWFDSGKLEGYKLPNSKDRRIPRKKLLKFLREHGMDTAFCDQDEWQTRVLFVTDDRLAAERARSLNGDDASFFVHVAQNAFEAGRYQATPQLVFIDFAIGRGEAMQLVRSLRASIGEQRPAVKYIGIVGEDESDPQSFVSETTFDHVWKHPCDVAALIESMFTEQGL